MDGAVVELLIQIAASIAETVVWTRPVPPTTPVRSRRARASLRELAVTYGEQGERSVATVGPALGSASVRIHGDTDRIVITCPWRGRGPHMAPRAPWDRLPPIFAPLRPLHAVDEVASSAECITVSGSLSLAERLKETLRALTDIASCGERRRARLEARGLRDGWSVVLSLDGSRVVLRRELACAPRARGSEHATHLLPPGATGVALFDGVIEIEWGHVPTDDEIGRLEPALRALARACPVYR